MSTKDRIAALDNALTDVVGKQASGVKVDWSPKLNTIIKLAIDVKEGGWDEGAQGETYSAKVQFSAVVKIRYSMGGWHTLYESSNRRAGVYQDPARLGLSRPRRQLLPTARTALLPCEACEQHR